MKKGVAKRILALGFALVLAAGCLSGCGSAEGGDASAGAASSDRLSDIIEKGKITIGVNPPGEPICFYDDEGNLIGYDVDWAYKLGETLGVDVELVEVYGENRISMVSSGRVDVIFANITGNLERAKSINFSIPYLKTGVKMAVRPGLENVQVISDLNDPQYKVALASGTTGEELVLEQAPEAEIIYVASLSDQCLALQEGRCDAILEDGTSLDYLASQSDYMEVRETSYTSDPICIGYAKGDPDFGRYLDMFVSYMISEGFQADTYYKWFGSEYASPMEHPW